MGSVDLERYTPVMPQTVTKPNSGAGVQQTPDEPHRGFLGQSRRLDGFSSVVHTRIYVTQLYRHTRACELV